MTYTAGAETPAPNEQPDENPFTSVPFNLTVPPIEVKWINALALGDYEIWLLVASLAFSAAIGFFVAFLQSGHVAHYLQSGHAAELKEPRDDTFVIVAVVFIVLFIIFIVRGLWLRRQIWKNAPTYQMTAR